MINKALGHRAVIDRATGEAIIDIAVINDNFACWQVLNKTRRNCRRIINDTAVIEQASCTGTQPSLTEPSVDRAIIDTAVIDRGL